MFSGACPRRLKGASCRILCSWVYPALSVACSTVSASDQRGGVLPGPHKMARRRPPCSESRRSPSPSFGIAQPLPQPLATTSRGRPLIHGVSAGMVPKVVARRAYRRFRIRSGRAVDADESAPIVLFCVVWHSGVCARLRCASCAAVTGDYGYEPRPPLSCGVAGLQMLGDRRGPARCPARSHDDGDSLLGDRLRMVCTVSRRR